MKSRSCDLRHVTTWIVYVEEGFSVVLCKISGCFTSRCGHAQICVNVYVSYFRAAFGKKNILKKTPWP